MNHAVGCETFKSRCIFIEETPFRSVVIRYTATTHLRSGSLLDSIGVPTLTLKYLRQSGSGRA